MADSDTTPWRDLKDNPPSTCDVVLLMDDGKEIEGEYWEPPPPSIDPDQVAGGFAWDGGSDLSDPAMPIKWRPR